MAEASASPSSGNNRRLALFHTMLRIRRFEERVLSLFRNAELRGTAHVCLGQEAVAAGACAALSTEDLVTSNHRGHGHMLARGADMGRMMAELFGRAEGYSGGVGGSQHMAASEVGFLGMNGITGGGLPIAVGAALSLVMQKKPGVVLAFFGDGAATQGAFHEFVNLAAVWRLPVVFLCENNRYAMGTPLAEISPLECISRRAPGYGIPGATVDGNDPLAVEDAVRQARARALEGAGPSLVEALTFRMRGHSRSDLAAYVPEAYREEARKRDPVPALSSQLRKEGVEESALTALLHEADAEVEAAVAFARSGTLLPVGPIDKKPSAPPTGREGKSAKSPVPPSPTAAPTTPGTATYADAVYIALTQALKDPRVVLLGEDIAEYGGAFHVTRDLYKRFGKERVRNTPICENTLIGCATGAAMTGLRPVVEIMFMDFLLLGLDQLANHAAKFGSIYGGQFRVPLTLRVPSGGRRGYGPTHSQCFEALLWGIPGLKVYTPASVQDAHDLLLQAIADDGPTVVVEHKLLYGMEGPFDPSAPPLPPGRMRLLRPGSDLTIAAFSHMTTLALAAAGRLEEEGISAEVIDLRTLVPLDLEGLAESVARTERLLVAEEGHRTGGVGGELAARIQEACVGYLDAPILRVAARDGPIPAAEHLERFALPQVEDILSAARSLVAG
ncbi:MAG: thiamine pyrophosphate-dependent enzyme [Planctomycetota bacterium]